MAEHISRCCGGDVRKAVNTVELSALSGDVTAAGVKITLETVKALAQRSNMRYDRDGDQHYDILSALQKSIRGSDENAAIHYAARLLEAGDLISLSRRLLVTTSEDVALAQHNAITIIKSCVDSKMHVVLALESIRIIQGVTVLITALNSNITFAGLN